MGASRNTSTAWAAALLLALFGAAGARAQSVDGAEGPPTPSTKAAPAAALYLSQALKAAPMHTLRSAEQDAAGELDALRAWNAAGKRPTKNGFARALPAPVEVRLAPSLAATGPAATPMSGGYLAAAAPGWLAWGTHVKVTGAHRVRLHLEKVSLPAGTRMYVAAPGGAPQAFGLELLAPGGDLWTPSVLGEAAMLEVDVPVAGLAAEPPSGFALREVMEIVDLAAVQPGGLASLVRHASSFGLAAAGFSSTPHAQSRTAAAPAGLVLKQDTSCLLDATCETNADLPGINNYRRAMAQLIFTIPGQGSFLCSGSLLNDTASNGVPYLLTANHCISDQPTASSLEAFWDFFTPSCNGTAPDESTLPTSNGSTLLVTQSADTSSDFTLLRLTSIPGNRFFLGWNANAGALQNGTPLYRLSYPAPNGIPLSLAFAQYTNDPGFNPPCGGIEAPKFVYEHLVRGATFGGSSGSPLLLTNGQVVGQLGGGCGPDPNNSCDYANDDFDGAFAVTFIAAKEFLAPPSPTAPCVAGATTVCIDNNTSDHRFQVSVTFHTSQGGGSSGNGQAIQLNSLGVVQGGLFSFFSPTNPEMLVKVLNGCALGGHFWVFYSAVTNVGFTVLVTDTATGHQRAYINDDLNPALAVQDTSALSCP